jgi:hypothetical protein
MGKDKEEQTGVNNKVPEHKVTRRSRTSTNKEAAYTMPRRKPGRRAGKRRKRRDDDAVDDVEENENNDVDDAVDDVDDAVEEDENNDVDDAVDDVGDDDARASCAAESSIDRKREPESISRWPKRQRAAGRSCIKKSARPACACM